MRFWNIFSRSLSYSLVCGSLILAPHSLLSQEIYRQVDAAGVVRYSSKKPDPQAVPAELPPIMKADFDVGVPAPESCEKHGGVDCQAGADADGSVVCADGFRGAVARFRFNCSAAKLEITDVTLSNEGGDATVFIRNSSSVAAKGVSITFNRVTNSNSELVGPKEIEAFGIAEFVIPGSEIVRPSKKLSTADFSAACANCN